MIIKENPKLTPWIISELRVSLFCIFLYISFVSKKCFQSDSTFVRLRNFFLPCFRLHGLGEFCATPTRNQSSFIGNLTKMWKDCFPFGFWLKSQKFARNWRFNEIARIFLWSIFTIVHSRTHSFCICLYSPIYCLSRDLRFQSRVCRCRMRNEEAPIGIRRYDTLENYQSNFMRTIINISEAGEWGKANGK